MIRYEIREICGDWAIYEVRPDAQGEYTESEPVLILNSRANAEYVKAILEPEAKDPNAAVRYFPRAELMSDAEVLAVFRMCAPDEVGACDKCPLKGRDVCREEINRRVLEMAEKYLEHEKPITLMEEIRKVTREIAYNDEMPVSAQFMLLERETLWDKVERLEQVERKFDQLKAIFNDLLIVEPFDKPGKLKPVKNTSKQDVYRAVLLAQIAVGVRSANYWLRTLSHTEEGENNENISD